MSDYRSPPGTGGLTRRAELTCRCGKGHRPEWRVFYDGLTYHVCTECLNGRLDAADEFPTFEPTAIEPFNWEEAKYGRASTEDLAQLPAV